jgi:hypothetical protein
MYSFSKERNTKEGLYARTSFTETKVFGMDEQEIKDKVSKKIGRRTEGFSQTFSIDEIDLRHEILGEIVKKLPLISYSGYKEIDEIIKDVLTL